MATETVFDAWAVSMYIFTIAVTMPVLFRAIHRNLPSGRIHALRAALVDLDEVFQHSLESGFLSDFAATTIRGRVIAFHVRADELHFRAMKATTFRADLMNAFRGLSGEISQAIRDVRALRGKISAMALDELAAQQPQVALSGHFNCVGGIKESYHCGRAILVAEDIDMITKSEETVVTV
ncbi:hypothetical protein L226DRAFT_575972 [Lentinus tigrinus ALCF2SS1-7]|uniref:Uncharacterized protein n=1 Tax=Lentinus tigrinus ALCF2SS1-6 TaxID=1328759 RepID=A0A5C2S2M1_9APHY|nr:hypothetical protein L227DRAFT_602188 [Lentinus tigrinus ALCF2SS1-6]RPD69051.1 hypothetical protein L226DRAFT_575972 [Lentinus tigrinus ALCF2SS1-7]